MIYAKKSTIKITGTPASPVQSYLAWYAEAILLTCGQSLLTGTSYGNNGPQMLHNDNASHAPIFKQTLMYSVFALASVHYQLFVPCYWRLSVNDPGLADFLDSELGLAKYKLWVLTCALTQTTVYILLLLFVFIVVLNKLLFNFTFFLLCAITTITTQKKACLTLQSRGGVSFQSPDDPFWLKIV